jgi:hypothetical protein
MAPGSYDLTVWSPTGDSATLHAAVQVQAAGSAPQPSATQAARSTQVAPTATRTPEQTQAAAATTAAPTPTPTETPIPTPSQQPTRSATQPPARQPAAPTRASATPDVTGTWAIVDTVQYGPGTGLQFPFTITLQQNGSQVSGGGSGITVAGTIQDGTISLGYRQDDGSTGSFAWTLDASGTLFQGTFDNSRGNGGSSAGRRTSGALSYSTFDSPASPSHGKKKGH